MGSERGALVGVAGEMPAMAVSWSLLRKLEPQHLSIPGRKKKMCSPVPGEHLGPPNPPPNRSCFLYSWETSLSLWIRGSFAWPRGLATIKGMWKGCGASTSGAPPWDLPGRHNHANPIDLLSSQIGRRGGRSRGPGRGWAACLGPGGRGLQSEKKTRGPGPGKTRRPLLDEDVEDDMFHCASSAR